MSWIPPSTSFLGRVLRVPLRWIPASTKVRIRKGPLHGYRWIAGASTHGYWWGTYEAEKVDVFINCIGSGDTVFDVGAHVGYYSLLASKLVGPSGKIFAFEPDPRNLEVLEAHLRLNDVTNVEVVRAAVTDQSGSSVSFKRGAHPATGRLALDGDLPVTTLALDEFVSSNRERVPGVMKIDIEGAEVAALQGAKHILQQHRPIVLLATHGAEVERDSVELLRDAGYDIEKLDEEEFLARPSASVTRD